MSVVLALSIHNKQPPQPLRLDYSHYTLTHDRFGHSNVHTNEKLTHYLRSTGTPHTDDSLDNVARIKNNHYRQKYSDLPEPVVFMSVTSSTSGRINEEFLLLG